MKTRLKTIHFSHCGRRSSAQKKCRSNASTFTGLTTGKVNSQWLSKSTQLIGGKQYDPSNKEWHARNGMCVSDAEVYSPRYGKRGDAIRLRTDPHEQSIVLDGCESTGSDLSRGYRLHEPAAYRSVCSSCMPARKRAVRYEEVWQVSIADRKCNQNAVPRREEPRGRSLPSIDRIEGNTGGICSRSPRLCLGYAHDKGQANGARIEALSRRGNATCSCSGQRLVRGRSVSAVENPRFRVARRIDTHSCNAQAVTYRLGIFHGACL